MTAEKAALPGGFVSPEAFAGQLELAWPQRVLLGLSGGADSVSLLDMLLQSGASVCAAHLNHGIRGEEADRDEAFCRALCRDRGVPFFCEKRDVPAEARAAGEGLEEAARRLRYEFFARLMQKEDIRLLCTAHNADDNAETVLMHLARGTGPRGVCGIAPARTFANGYLLRPLLGVSRAEILGYCRKRGLSFVTDSTNADTAYARNRIRAAVLPELRKINPDFVGSVSAFCASQREDCDWLDSLARDFLADRPLPTGSELASLAPPVASRVLRLLAAQYGANPEHGHVRTLLAGIRAGKRTTVAMPGGILFTVSPRRPAVLRKDERKRKNNTNGE